VLEAFRYLLVIWKIYWKEWQALCRDREAVIVLHAKRSRS